MATKEIETLDLMSKSDIELINLIEKIKRNISQWVDKKSIIQEITGYIEKSEVLNFRSQRSKMLSETIPLFTLTIDKELCNQKYNYIFGKDENRDHEYIYDKIKKEITRPFSDFLFNFQKTDKFKTLFEGLDIEDRILGLEISEFIISSVFSIRVVSEQNIIEVEFVM